MTAALALTLYLAGLALAFGGRSIAQRRRTGDTGLRMHAGPAGSIAWWAKLSFIAALLLGAAGPIAGLAGMPTVNPLDHLGYRIAGLILAVAGVTATLAAQLNMGASWRVGVNPAERTALVTGGVFAVARNPIFTAMTVSSAGLTLMVPNLLSVAATAILVLSIQPQVRAVEEPYLTKAHGAAYSTYAARVGRFVPGIGRLERPAARSGPPSGQENLAR